MSVISVKCPACGETFQADNEREFAFCTYCGNKVELSQINTEVSQPEEQALKCEAETSQNEVESSIVSTAKKEKMSKEEFQRKKAFERRCAEQIAFFCDQLAKPDKKIVNTRSFFNKHMTQWQEAQYRVQKELQNAEDPE